MREILKIEPVIEKAKYYVYILEAISKNKRKTFYTGYTNNLERRVEEHEAGKGAKYCKGRRVRLIYHEHYKTRKEAMRRETEIKKLSPQEKKNLIGGSR